MSEVEHDIEQAAHEAGADAGAVAAAVVAPAAAAEAAHDAVEEVVEHVEQLVERAEEAIETQEDDAQWERLQTTLLESEQRTANLILTQLPTAIATAMLNSASLSATTAEPTPTEQLATTADELSEAAEELAEEAEGELPEDGAVTFDPLAVESAPQAESASRRRPRGLGRRR